MKIKDWLIGKLGGITRDELDATNRKHKDEISRIRKDVDNEKEEYKKAAGELIRNGKMVRVSSEYGSDDFVVQFRTSKRFVENVFIAGNDENAIQWFSESVGQNIFHAIRAMNYTRPVQYRKPDRLW